MNSKEYLKSVRGMDLSLKALLLIYFLCVLSLSQNRQSRQIPFPVYIPCWLICRKAMREYLGKTNRFFLSGYYVMFEYFSFHGFGALSLGVIQNFLLECKKYYFLFWMTLQIYRMPTNRRKKFACKSKVLNRPFLALLSDRAPWSPVSFIKKSIKIILYPQKIQNLWKFSPWIMQGFVRKINDSMWHYVSNQKGYWVKHDMQQKGKSKTFCCFISTWRKDDKLLFHILLFSFYS